MSTLGTPVELARSAGTARKPMQEPERIHVSRVRARFACRYA
jgi:hypothetical protein